MYCGICVEVCPFDALFWGQEDEYSEPRIVQLLHEKDKLGEWMHNVSPPRASSSAPRSKARSDERRAVGMAGRRSPLPSSSPSWRCPRWPSSRSATWSTPRCALVAGAGRMADHTSCCSGGVRRLGPGPRLHRCGDRPVPVRHHAHPGADGKTRPGQQPARVGLAVAALSSCVLAVLLGTASRRGDRLAASPTTERPGELDLPQLRDRLRGRLAAPPRRAGRRSRPGKKD